MSDDSHKITSQAACYISDISVEVGDKVTEGQVLAITEVMKMMMPVKADCSGKLSRIPIAAGDNVQPGDTLFVIDKANGLTEHNT